MCGFYLAFENFWADGVSRYRADAIRHRGPDESSYKYSDDAAFGPVYEVFHRLSVNDLSHNGMQPFASTDGLIRVFVNGEIYNHKELKQKFSLECKSESDAEVVLQLYQLFGSSSMVRLISGIFAICIIDSRVGEVYLIRDRMGVKPLFYKKSNRGFLCGVCSEISPLVTAQSIVLPEALVEFSAYGYIPSPKTLYADIACVEPASMVVIRRDGAIYARKYWSLVEEFSQSRERLLSVGTKTYEEEVEHAYMEVFRQQYSADREVALLLSDGVDSASLAAANHLSRAMPLKTYTLNVGHEHTDLNVVHAVCEAFGCSSTVVDANYSPFNIDEITHRFSQPFADTSYINCSLLLKQIAHRHQVVMAGDGGDEALGGYRWHNLFARSKNAVAKMGVRNSLRLLRRRATLGTIHPSEIYRQLIHSSDLFFPHSVQRLLGIRVSDGYLEHFETFMFRDLHVGDMLRLLDAQTYLPNDILMKVDHASALHGLEARVPLCDDRLFPMLLALPFDPISSVDEGKKF